MWLKITIIKLCLLCTTLSIGEPSNSGYIWCDFNVFFVQSYSASIYLIFLIAAFKFSTNVIENYNNKVMSIVYYFGWLNANERIP